MSKETKHEVGVWIARVVSLAILGIGFVIGNADDFGVGKIGLAWLGLTTVLIGGLAQYLPKPLGEPTIAEKRRELLDDE